ncbi:MAG: DUF4440 domain-containing protein [Paracoccaceae bacterium]
MEHPPKSVMRTLLFSNIEAKVKPTERGLSGMDQDTHDQLKALEESLWRAETRFDDALMDQIFAEDFCEFGRSGRIYQRHEMLLGQGNKAEIEAILPLRDFSVRALSKDIVQVMYVSEVKYGSKFETGNRSSIWRRDATGWRLCFHQGTPTNLA